MKQWYFHVIYLSIIAFLGYNYWRDPSVKKAFFHKKTLILPSKLCFYLKSLKFENDEKTLCFYPLLPSACVG
jgi:hypothetical protein